jgi:hypothetical protein
MALRAGDTNRSSARRTELRSRRMLEPTCITELRQPDIGITAPAHAAAMPCAVNERWQYSLAYLQPVIPIILDVILLGADVFEECEGYAQRFPCCPGADSNGDRRECDRSGFMAETGGPEQRQLEPGCGLVEPN